MILWLQVGESGVLSSTVSKRMDIKANVPTQTKKRKSMRLRI